MNSNNEQGIMDTGIAGRYNPYPAYKDSAIEWLGEIPAKWEVKRLKTIALIHLSNVDKKTEEGEEPIQLCNYIDVYYHEKITNDLEFMSATATANQIRKFSLRKNDVLITKDSESWTDIAVSSVIIEDLPGVICGYHLAHIRPSDVCFGPFLSYAFNAIGPRDQFQIAANGITRFGLGGNAISSGLFMMPSIGEQRSIAAFLDRETARIDALVEKNERLIELLQEKRITLISHAVTKGLDPDAPMKDSRVEWLGEIPAHWEVTQLKRSASIRYGLGEPPKLLNDGLPFIRATDISSGRISNFEMQYIDPKDVPWSRNPILRTGDIVIVRSGAYTGDSAIIPKEYDGAIIGYDMVIRPRRGLNSNFLGWALLSKYMLNAQIELERMRAAQPHLNAEELGIIILLLPPMLEQQTIVKFLDSETMRIDALVAKVKDVILRLKEYRSALISAAVTGKIDVRGEIS